MSIYVNIYIYIYVHNVSIITIDDIIVNRSEPFFLTFHCLQKFLICLRSERKLNCGLAGY